MINYKDLIGMYYPVKNIDTGETAAYRLIENSVVWANGAGFLISLKHFNNPDSFITIGYLEADNCLKKEDVKLPILD